MAVITVPGSGAQVSNVTLDDTLQAAAGVDLLGSPVYYEVDGNSTLVSLSMGYDISLIIGFLNSGNLTGSGNITGASDPTVGNLPSIDNYDRLDINGAIDVDLTNDGRLTVSPGERLDIEGSLLSFGASTVTVAAGAQLVINSPTTAIVTDLNLQGTVIVSSELTTFEAPTVLSGAVIVAGDALSAYDTGIAAARNTGNPGGTYVATLDVRQSVLAQPIGSLTLAQDAAIEFGGGTYSIERLNIAGAPTAFVPLDVVTVAGTLTVTGDGTGAPNQVSVAEAEFTGSGTVKFAVSGTDGGASLQQQVTVDAGTTLRNDGVMTIGGQAGGTTAFGASTAALGSSFINDAAAQLTIGGGAVLSVAAIQNAGLIIVAGDTTVAAPLTNTGTIDVTSGTLTLQSPIAGAGAIDLAGGAVTAAALTGSTTIGFSGGGTLALGSVAGANTVNGFTYGDAIDLLGNTSVSLNGSTIGTATGSINLGPAPADADYQLLTDGNGGTLVTLTPQTIGVYRFFDSEFGTHFYTASQSEEQTILATRPDLIPEGPGGIGLQAISFSNTDPNAEAVYRFFDTIHGTHFFTASASERDTVIATRPDLTYEPGSTFYEHTVQQPGDVAVYRFFDSTYGTHFYTDSASERATIITTRPDLVSEGIGFYEPPQNYASA